MSNSIIRKLAIGAVAALVLLFVISRARRAAVAQHDAALFAGTTNIVFTKPEPSTNAAGGMMKRELAVSATNDVSVLVSAIHLRRKDPCACGPHYSAAFQKPSGQLWVSFCGHCFDVLGETDSYVNAHYYRMPKDFFAGFQRLGEERGLSIRPSP